MVLLPAGEYRALGVHARILLCARRVLQTLYAYPDGRPARLTSCASSDCSVRPPRLLDGLHSLAPSGRLAPLVRRYARPAAIGHLASVALAYPVLAYRAHRLYAFLAHTAGFAGSGANPFGEAGSRRLPMAGGPLEAELRHLRGPAGNTQPLFGPGKPLPGPVHRPPGPLNYDDWMYTFSNAQQQRSWMTSRATQTPAPSTTQVASIPGTGANSMSADGRWPNYIPDALQRPFGQTGDYQFMIRTSARPANHRPPYWRGS